MRISEINLNNFRIYKNVNNILIDVTEDQNVTIISGKNGFGKTTFLMSLVWCLFGKNTEKVDDFYKKEIQDQGGYAKYIANSLNRLAKVKGESKFFVSIVFTDVSISTVPFTTIKVTRIYDSEASTPDKVEIYLYGDNENTVSYMNLVQEYGFEQFIRDYLIPIESAKFFFFDAEKIVSLAESNTIEQSRELSKAYSEVLGIKKYEDLRERLESVRAEYAKQSANPEEQRLFNELNVRIENIDNEILEIKEKISELEEQLADFRLQAQDIQSELIMVGQKITEEEKNALQSEVLDLENRQESIKKQLDILYELIPFAISGDLLVQVKSQVEDEISIRNVKYKAQDIEKKTNQILNEIEESKKQTHFSIDGQTSMFLTNEFQKLIRKYFGNDTQEIANVKEILNFSEIEANKLNTLVNQLKRDFKPQFKILAKEYQENKRVLDSTRRKLNEAEARSEDPIVASWREKKGEIDNTVKNIQKEIDNKNREIGALESERKQKSTRITDLGKKIKVAEEYKEKDALSKQLIAQVKEVTAKFKKEKMKLLEKRIFEGLKILMHKNNFVSSVKVSMPDDNIVIDLLNDRSEIIPKESLSKGEKQLYAMALLKSLVDESGINFPIFIDSPLQKLDKTHSRNVIRYFYPKVSEQVVILPTLGKELTRDEFEILKPNISRNYLIRNINKDQSEFVEVENNTLFETYQAIYKEEI
jgi:DNA sulfur modification protein DndD